jgi:hypothetical protein
MPVGGKVGLKADWCVTSVIIHFSLKCRLTCVNYFVTEVSMVIKRKSTQYRLLYSCLASIYQTACQPQSGSVSASKVPALIKH